MNITEFNTKIGHAMQEAMNTGVAAKTLSVPEIVGILEMHKMELIRWAQDQARIAASKPPIILPANGARFTPPK